MLKRVSTIQKHYKLLSFQSLRNYTSQTGKIKKTSLYNFHVDHDAKMVPFCGWYMPLTYGKDGTVKPHLHCRKGACLFDVSHMGQLKFTGKDRIEFLESLVPAALRELKVGQSRLTQLTNEKGGIMDDTILTNKGDWIFEIVNAGCAEQDIAYFKQQLEKWKEMKKDVNMEILSEQNSLIALQGPKAAKVLQKYVKEDLSKIAFMTSWDTTIFRTPAIITRCGYTGEDGFEISLPHEKMEALVERLHKESDVLLAGLGPRDTLRLEAGLCLYGNDMTPEITPVEAGLTWTIQKRRRQEGGFPGDKVILKQIKEGVEKIRIGFEVQDTSGIARHGYKLFNEEGQEIGVVTSGTKTPGLEKPIGLGYVKTDYSKEGTNIFVEIRKKKFPVKVVATPFVKLGYYRPPAAKK